MISGRGPSGNFFKKHISPLFGGSNAGSYTVSMENRQHYYTVKVPKEEIVKELRKEEILGVEKLNYLINNY